MKKRLQESKKKFYTNKGSILQEDIIIIYIYASNNRPSKYMKQKLWN